jgi:ADP-heptose:LPS heptosyltransferase
MGLGDDLMITGIVEQESIKHPDKQIVIGSLKENLIFDSIIYLNNPKITHSSKLDRTKPVHFINYSNLNRFYINYQKHNDNNIIWRTDFKLIPGKIYFSKKEIDDALQIIDQAKHYWNANYKTKPKKIIFFESYSTKSSNDYFSYRMKNKNWGEANWKKLINKLKDKYLIIQSVHEKSIKIDGTYYADKGFDFRTACAVLKNCDLFLGNEGSFGHVSAAVNIKAVIYFGGWISPKSTGYDMHTNIYYDASESPCGAKSYQCKHCENARREITVNYMEEKIKLTLE